MIDTASLYRIVECDPDSERQTLHAALTTSVETLCERKVSHSTSLPLAYWGHPERTFCRMCAARLRRAGVAVPKGKVPVSQ